MSANTTSRGKMQKSVPVVGTGAPPTPKQQSFFLIYVAAILVGLLSAAIVFWVTFNILVSTVYASTDSAPISTSTKKKNYRVSTSPSTHLSEAFTALRSGEFDQFSTALGLFLRASGNSFERFLGKVGWSFDSWIMATTIALVLGLAAGFLIRFKAEDEAAVAKARAARRATTTATATATATATTTTTTTAAGTGTD